MGSSTVVTHMILFIAVMGIATGLIMSIQSYSDKAQGDFKQKSDAFSRQIKTAFKIEVVHYNNETNTTHLYARNTGLTSLEIDKLDIYIDGMRFPRDELNRTIEVLSDTEITNIGLWDTKEELKITAFLHLDDGLMHEVVVTTPYGVKDTETFST